MKSQTIFWSALGSLILAAPLSAQKVAQDVTKNFAQNVAQTSSPSTDVSAATAASADDEAHYAAAMQAIEHTQWGEAQKLFATLASGGGEHAEAALYWQAYAAHQAGEEAKALETCAELHRRYPSGKYLEECQALEIEIRGRRNERVVLREFHGERDGELKLLALNSLMQQDELRALPQIKSILNKPDTDKLKEQALFVLMQSRSKEAQAMMDQIARGKENVKLQGRALEMIAAIRGAEAVPLLTEVYRTSSDSSVKRSVLQAFAFCGDPEKLADLAAHEPDARLSRAAVQSLGLAGATPELEKLYQTGDVETRAAVLDAWVLTGGKGAALLEKAAATESDPKLRLKAVRLLGITGGEKTAPTLVTAYHNSQDRETKRAVVDALFLGGHSHELITLAREEKEPEMKRYLAEHILLTGGKESEEYAQELLAK